MVKKTIISGIIVTIMLILISLSFLVVKIYSKNKLMANELENIDNSVISSKATRVNNVIETSNSDNQKISPSAKLEMTEYYRKCGHTIKNEYKVPSAVVNMTKDNVKKYYSDWDIEYFSKDCIKLYRINDGICKEHYTIKDTNGYINVFIKNEEGEEELYRATDIITKYLSEHDKTALSTGVLVEGKNNLEKILEDFQ